MTLRSRALAWCGPIASRARYLKKKKKRKEKKESHTCISTQHHTQHAIAYTAHTAHTAHKTTPRTPRTTAHRSRFFSPLLFCVQYLNGLISRPFSPLLGFPGWTWHAWYTPVSPLLGFPGRTWYAWYTPRHPHRRPTREVKRIAASEHRLIARVEVDEDELGPALVAVYEAKLLLCGPAGANNLPGPDEDSLPIARLPRPVHRHSARRCVQDEGPRLDDAAVLIGIALAPALPLCVTLPVLRALHPFR